MNKSFFVVCLLMIFLITDNYAQWDKKEQRGEVNTSALNIQPIISSQLKSNTPIPKRFKGQLNYRSLPGAALNLERGVHVQVHKLADEASLWVEGTLDARSSARDLDRSAQRNLFLKHALVKSGQGADLSFKVMQEQKEQAVEHFKMRQLHEEIPVWGNEITLHVNNQEFQLMGRLRKDPFAEKVIRVSQSEAETQIITELEIKGVTIFSPGKKNDLKHILEDDTRELVWYPHDGRFKLAWHLSYHPNLASRWEYFVDASDGAVLEAYESICKAHHLPPDFFDGKSVGTGPDLNGINQTIQTYQIGSTHTLIDVSRSDMFDPRGSIPNNPIGTIITVDAVNTFPGGDNFNYRDLVSNSTTWNNPDAVSAHVNAATAYEFFRTTFNRISVNGQGGNIISFINVADEDGQRMDNAFWNGKAIFYGRGNQAFSSPLARALDVAAHELGHGVIGTTANLEYQGESGALNESFADVFGVIVEREDWLIGEDVVNKNIFGEALRNMADPHNGGNNLDDPGYQPDHYQERYTGTDDNGGVHINSGIPNKAFYHFAESVGLSIAEKVYYSVLTNYLTRSSRFVDMRIAVIAASRALYNEQVAQAAATAFDQVGIVGDQAGDYVEDVEVNPGQDFILVTSTDDGLLRIIDPQGNSLTEGPLSEIPPLNPPSITDDGSLVIYVAFDKTMHSIEFDWTSGSYQEGTIEANKIWHNVAVSKDGSKLAATLDNTGDSIFIFSLEQGTVNVFELYNPTTASGNIVTADVLFPDALEWDHSGEYLMYDAFNVLKSFNSAESFEYWDIGFIRVWNEAANAYGDGFITKLFSGLPELISVANPTFSKNSPYIIAFDYLDEAIAADALSILGVNIETYDIGTIYESNTAGYPSFSRSDDRIIFDAIGEDQTTTFEAIGSIMLAPDKINSNGDASIFFRSAIWGEWFGNGDRALVNILEGDTETGHLKIFPNPAEHTLHLEADWLENPGNLTLGLYSIDGKLLRDIQTLGGSKIMDVTIDDLQPGLYILKLKSDTVHRIYKVVKK